MLCGNLGEGCRSESRSLRLRVESASPGPSESANLLKMHAPGSGPAARMHKKHRAPLGSDMPRIAGFNVVAVAVAAIAFYAVGMVFYGFVFMETWGQEQLINHGYDPSA